MRRSVLGPWAHELGIALAIVGARALELEARVDVAPPVSSGLAPRQGMQARGPCADPETKRPHRPTRQVVLGDTLAWAMGTVINHKYSCSIILLHEDIGIIACSARPRAF